MTITLKCVVRYDGTDFAGWQVQPGQCTVQGTIEEALSKIANREVRILGAGRTDSGVHALGQVFSCPWPRDDAALGTLRRSLSSMLAPEMRIERIERVPDTFHPIHDAKQKHYSYVISRAKAPDPFAIRYAWSIPWELDIPLLERLLSRVEGEHDFGGFCSSGSAVQSTRRTITSLTLGNSPVVGPIQGDQFIRLDFQGDGFLYKMVRNITGTLIDIARGKNEEAQLQERLHAPQPYHGFTAPPQGLFMMGVYYV